MNECMDEQDMTKGHLGLNIYRGHVMCATCDYWVIGSKLGSKEGLRAYLDAPHIRWPHLPLSKKESWQEWDPSEFKWFNAKNASVKMEFIDSSNWVGQVIGRCPMPSCSKTSMGVCPPEGSCDECICTAMIDLTQKLDLPPAASEESIVEHLVGPHPHAFAEEERILQRRQAAHETAPTPEYIDPTAKKENKTAEKKTAEKEEDEGVNKIWIYVGASVGALALIAGIGGITYCCMHQRR
eukprot:GHVU01223419.1.p1 GENE.GHVU01223419.1~~GHVU01223419.1.p1  ORF type:complete len:239 (-),score=38.85 GHVU01223419.1:92-808(-)